MCPRRVGPAGAAMTMFICLLVPYRLLANRGWLGFEHAVPRLPSCAALAAMAAKKTFLESMEPLDARMQLAALVSPRELLYLSAASKRLRSALYGNRSPLRAIVRLQACAQQTLIIDLLNAPKADSEDTFNARYGCLSLIHI